MYKIRDDVYDDGNTGNFFEKSNSDEYVQSESDGLSVAKVLRAISDDRSWSLFTTIASSSDPSSNGQQSGAGRQILITQMNLTRKQYYQRINRLRSLGLINSYLELIKHLHQLASGYLVLLVVVILAIFGFGWNIFFA